MCSLRACWLIVIVCCCMANPTRGSWTVLVGISCSFYDEWQPAQSMCRSATVVSVLANAPIILHHADGTAYVHSLKDVTFLPIYYILGISYGKRDP